MLVYTPDAEEKNPVWLQLVLQKSYTSHYYTGLHRLFLGQ